MLCALIFLMALIF